MSDVPSPAAPRPFADARWDRVPLYRWWRRCVVDTVDHEQVMGRIVDESGLTARYVFMTMMSAGIAVLGLLLSSPAVVIGAIARLGTQFKESLGAALFYRRRITTSPRRPSMSRSPAAARFC
jgi:hypothetical protein